MTRKFTAQRRVVEVRVKDEQDNPTDSKRYKVFRVFDDGTEMFWMGFVLRKQAILFGIEEAKRLGVPVKLQVKQKRNDPKI